MGSLRTPWVGVRMSTRTTTPPTGASRAVRSGKVAHSVGESIQGMVHTNGIEPSRAFLKRGRHLPLMCDGHLRRYVNEFSGRCNTVGQSTMAKVERVVAGMAGRRLTYRQLIC